MLSLVLSAHPELERGLTKLVQDQFIGWQEARQRQGTVVGPLAMAGATHPDLATRWGGLKLDTQLFICSLTMSRVQGFRAMPLPELDTFIAYGSHSVPLDRLPIPADVAAAIAVRIHDEWWHLRMSWSWSGHAGDKPWSLHTSPERRNDLEMVPFWAKLLFDYSVSPDADCQAVIKYIRRQ